MIRKDYHYQIITPCSCGGATPQSSAEIRASSIRGQMRWWFRALGGFSGYPGTPREQEQEIFGAAAGEAANAGFLTIRVRANPSARLTASRPLPKSDPQTVEGYLQFPLRTQERHQVDYGAFVVTALWRGNQVMLPYLDALFTIFGELGALGFRSRRTFGALRMPNPSLPLSVAFLRFNKHAECVVKKLDIHSVGFQAALASAKRTIKSENARRATENRPNKQKNPIPELELPSISSSESAIQALAVWLKHHRSYKLDPHTKNNAATNTSFQFSEKDHDRGLDTIQGRGNASDLTYRPAIGLPIQQRFHRDGTVMWEKSQGQKKGRFASPVILRPYKDTNDQWHALVIFMDARRWETGSPVYVGSEKRTVCLDLYNAMKSDPSLHPFPPIPECGRSGENHPPAHPSPTP